MNACCVYAIVEDGRDLPTDGSADPDCPVYRVSYQGLRAVVSDVSLDEYGEEALDSNLCDADWLAAKVLAHQHILDGLLACNVVPMRFCTIYSNQDRVREMLEAHYDYFLSVLARLEGKQEWGVKVYCAPSLLNEKIAELSEVVKTLNSRLAGKSDGAAYFLKKKIDEAIAVETDRIGSEAAQDSHNRLLTRSWEAVVNPLLGREVTRREEDMVLNGAYLVSRDCVETFRTELDGLRDKYAGIGFSYEISGPWPPYNFANAAPGEDCVDEPVRA